MTDFKDIAILGLVVLSISDKLGGLNLGGLFGSGTPADPKVEVKITESITCTCADGFQGKYAYNLPRRRGDRLNKRI